MGHYHGEEGFRNFSKAKGVIRKGRINTAALVAPPWGNLMYRGLMWFMEKKYRPVKIK
jgi:coniferyl-aldehyde dehydrogenase